jgi:hypothetical protein
MQTPEQIIAATDRLVAAHRASVQAWLAANHPRRRHPAMKGRSQMTVRAKFKLVEVHSLAWSGRAKRFKFSAEYDSSIPEDRRFAQATPMGTLEFLVDNPEAADRFEIGKSYYLDFSPVPDPA